MKKLYNVEDFFPAAGDQRFSLSAESPLDNVTYNIFTADDFTDAAIYDYGERKFYCPETDTPLASFYARFARWKAQRGVDIAAAYGALRAKYNPLFNYDSTETKTGTETGLKTPTDWIQTTERTPDLTRTQTDTPTQWQKTIVDSASDYHETTTETPGTGRGYSDTESFTNYHETETQTPTDWIETVTQTPDDWAETTTGLKADNTASSKSSVFAFNSAGTDGVPVGITEADNNTLTTVERTGTFDTTKEQAGTFETDKEFTGTKTVQHSETGTLTNDTTITGTKTATETQSGTYETETTETGTDTTTVEQAGTFEDKMTYNTTLKRSGNIGVTSSEQLINSELDLRARQYVREVIREFFDLVTVYC